MYIAIEGIDFVGKSSQLEILKKNFPDAIFTKEPSGMEFGETIRNIVLHGNYNLEPLSEFLLFIADRSNHFQKIVKPNLENGKMVISDRSLVSGIAYGLSSEKIDEKRIFELNTLSIENRLPDLVIFLTISEEELIKRKKGKIGDNIEKRGIEYSLKVQKNIADTIEKLKIPKLEIDSSYPIEVISQQISEFILSCQTNLDKIL